MGKEKVILPIKIRVLDNLFIFGQGSANLRACQSYVTVMLRHCYGNVLEKSVAKVILIFEICKRKMDNFYFWLKN